MKLKKKMTPVLFLAPAMIGIFIFKVFPIFQGIYDSFFQYSFVNQDTYFSGFQNYIDALTDPIFLNSIKVTMIFNIIVNPLQVFISFGLGLLLMTKVKGQKIFRTIHLIPITVSLGCIDYILE